MQRLLANAVDLFHGAISLWWIFGFALFLPLRFPLSHEGLEIARWVQVALVLSILPTEACFHWRCPITILSQRLWTKIDPHWALAREGFIEGLLTKIGIGWFRSRHVRFVEFVGAMCVAIWAVIHVV